MLYGFCRWSDRLLRYETDLHFVMHLCDYCDSRVYRVLPTSMQVWRPIFACHNLSVTKKLTIKYLSAFVCELNSRSRSLAAAYKQGVSNASLYSTVTFYRRNDLHQRQAPTSNEPRFITHTANILQASPMQCACDSSKSSDARPHALSFDVFFLENPCEYKHKLYISRNWIPKTTWEML